MWALLSPIKNASKGKWKLVEISCYLLVRNGLNEKRTKARYYSQGRNGLSVHTKPTVRSHREHVGRTTIVACETKARSAVSTIVPMGIMLLNVRNRGEIGK